MIAKIFLNCTKEKLIRKSNKVPLLKDDDGNWKKKMRCQLKPLCIISSVWGNTVIQKYCREILCSGNVLVRKDEALQRFLQCANIIFARLCGNVGGDNFTSRTDEFRVNVSFWLPLFAFTQVAPKIEISSNYSLNYLCPYLKFYLGFGLDSFPS